MHKRDAEHICVIGLGSITVSVFLGFVAAQSVSLSLIDVFFESWLAFSVTTSFIPYAIGVSSVGGFWSVLLVSIVISLMLVLTSRIREAFVWLVAIGVAGALSETLKYFFLLERPLRNITEATSPAFPSGHATAVWTLATLAILTFVLPLKKKSLRLLSALTLIVLATAISASRMILGVHWFSDILGGFFLGIGTALAIFGLAHLFGKK